MNVTAQSQIEAIHAMMAKGQRSVRMEPHTLLIWGLTAALITLYLQYFFPRSWFSDHTLLVFVENVLLAVVLTAAGFADFVLTRRARRARGETISFVQLQITKIWWFLVGLIVVMNISMNFFGGGFVFYSIVLVILGIAFYVHGLFSENMLSWVGVSLLLLGLGSLGAQVPPYYSRWLLLTVLGIGFPLLAYVQGNSFFYSTRIVTRLLFSGVFAFSMLLPMLCLYQFDAPNRYSSEKPMSLIEYAQSAQESLHTVTLPAGSKVPLQVEVESPLLQGKRQQFTLPLQLSDDVQIAVKNGKPTGFFRWGDKPWQEYGANVRFRVDERDSDFDTENGLRLHLHLKMNSTH